MTFDTLSYARRLKAAGLPDAQAEAIADATRELVVQDVATKPDIAAVKADLAGVRAELKAEIDAPRIELKADIDALRIELKADIAGVRADMSALEQRLSAAIDTQGLRLTVRMGGLIAVGVAVLAAIIKL